MTGRLTSYTRQGLTFDVCDEGPVGGVPVVLLHGFPQTAASWDKVVPHLHDRGYRTVAPTQRGYSPGARPRGRAAYRMSALVADTVALLDALDAGPVHLVGHDWGASVAWTTSARWPERVQTLTTVSVPPPMAFLRSLVRSNQALRTWYMAAFQVPWLPELVLRQRAQLARGLTSAGLSAEQAEQVLVQVVDTGALSGAVNWYRAMLIAGPRATRHRVSVPTTHVWSPGDRFISPVGAELTAACHAGPLRIEQLDSTHWIPDNRPAELAELVAARIEGRA